MTIINIKRFIRDNFGFILKDINLDNYNVIDNKIDCVVFYVHEFKFSVYYSSVFNKYVLNAYTAHHGIQRLKFKEE